VLAAGAALALTTACGGPAASSSGSAAASGGAASSGSGGVVNITWQTMWSGNTLTLLSQMVSEFNATHPNIHVTESNIPSSSGDAKLLSEIAAGDPPDVFTEWNPVLGEYAADGSIQSMTPYLAGSYTGLEKWLYPIALQGGEYNSTLYALPMSMNSWALYYNKSMLKAAGISAPPATLAQLYADQAKEWKISGGKLDQIGFYPDYNAGFEYYGSFFGAVNCFGSTGSYNFENCSGAKAEANFFSQYNQYPYSSVAAMQTAYGAVAGGDDDAFVAGKEGFNMDGPWEGAEHPGHQPGDGEQLRRRGVPEHGGRTEHVRPGQLQHHPEGLGAPAAGVRVHRLAGRLQQRDVQRADRPQGRLDARLAVGRVPARLPDVAEGQPVAERVRPADVQPDVGHAQAHQVRVPVRDRRGDRDRGHRRAQQDAAAGAGLHRPAGQQRRRRLTGQQKH
jgi:maltose-binding protein MalE